MNIQELVEYIAKELVDAPEQVKVHANESANALMVELQVAPDDMGRVIGKSGRVANALRTLVRVAAVRQGKRAILDVVDQPHAARRHYPGHNTSEH